MKKALIIVILVFFCGKAFALNSFVCSAHMQGKTPHAPKSISAPALIGQGLNSLLRAKDNTDHIFLHFNPQTVSETKADVIVDGRNKRILMNTHISVSKKNNIISITLRDTVTKEVKKSDFESTALISMALDNDNAYFGLNCQAL